jgi:ketosteroid isomerase-like protein
MEPDLKAVIDALEESGTAWVRGDASGFAEHASRSEDFSIMGPFGGPPLVGWEKYAATAPRVASLFTGGESRTEIVSAYRSGDLLVTVQIEHQKVVFAGDSEPQDWNLRVTQVYRREDGTWRVVHRHADPLVALRTPDEAKAIARHRSTAVPPAP